MQSWLLITLVLGTSTAAHAQDGVHARWLGESQAAKRAVAVHHVEASGPPFLHVVRADMTTRGGRDVVVVRGTRRSESRGPVTRLFERWVEVLDYAVVGSGARADAPRVGDDVWRRAEASFDACEASFDGCLRGCTEDSCMDGCATTAEGCVFGEQVLLRAEDAELVVRQPLRSPGDARREATLRWGGLDLGIFIPTRNSADALDDGGVDQQLGFAALSSHRRVLVLSILHWGDDDPPTETFYFILDHRRGRIVEIRDPRIADTRFLSVLPGDGTIRVLGSAWGDCERQGHPRRARRTEIVVHVDDDGTVRSARRRNRRGHWSCHDLPACPYVDLLGPEGPRRLGEILRNVREGAETRTLALEPDAPPRERTLRVRIVEEKPETTHLDAVRVRAGDLVLAPRACDTEAPPLYCEADGRFFVLREGEHLELEVDVPAGLPAVLEVTGYYRPGPLE